MFVVGSPLFVYITDDCFVTCADVRHHHDAGDASDDEQSERHVGQRRRLLGADLRNHHDGWVALSYDHNVIHLGNVIVCLL